jgi:hypothetical protein
VSKPALAAVFEPEVRPRARSKPPKKRRIGNAARSIARIHASASIKTRRRYMSGSAPGSSKAPSLQDQHREDVRLRKTTRALRIQRAKEMARQ